MLAPADARISLMVTLDLSVLSIKDCVALNENPSRVSEASVFDS